MHIGTAQAEFIAKALQQVDTLQPRFLLITGDNNFLEAAPADPKQPEPLGLRRQRFLKQFLQDHLKTPYVLIPGNNWPEEFDKVFGAKQYSFDCGGLHFMLLDADRAYRGPKGANVEGFTAFNDSTWDWIGRDLERSRGKPVVVALHEPICPLTFLDARRLRELLDRYPNVFLVLQGHLHVDLEFHRNGTTYLVAPALGKTSAPAMKLVNVYPEGLVVRTISYRKRDDRFEMTDRCQKIEIAEALRGGLAKPSETAFTMAHYDCVPPHPFVEDPALAGRTSDLWKNARDLLLPGK
jgi:3',5'-cyclic AMP phosphodiesterase CpdA